MNYLYYPGCSLEGTAQEYDMSTRALLNLLDISYTEISDWTCCGATAAESVSYLLSLSLPARVLAIAEKMDNGDQVLVPCSSCYLNLKKVEEKIKQDPALLTRLNTVLNAEDLRLTKHIKVKHLLEVLSKDIHPDTIRAKTRHSLDMLTIAPYYGCQCLRPYPVFDDPEVPVSMEPLLSAVGAKVHQWDMGSKCCGASQMATKSDIAIKYVADILRAAKGADAIVTVCPMCQMNLEAYQEKACNMAKEDLHMSILYLPQLLGTALGLPTEKLGYDLNLSVSKDLRLKMTV
ncbi:MAG: CoB--CoM heterodisulfide reductase iron-sulfur subunit B family protein [Pseudomonadota bacterium]